MTFDLEAPQEELAHEVAGVQRVGRRVEADVQTERALRQTGRERVTIGGVVYEPASVEVGEEIHRPPCCHDRAPSLAPVSLIRVRGTIHTMTSLEELAKRFRDFAGEATVRAPLYSCLSAAIADDPELVELLQAAPPEQQSPVLLFAAVHYLLLDGNSHELTDYYPNLVDPPRPANQSFGPFRRFVLQHAGDVATLVATRSTQTNEVGRCALFLPALAMLERRRGPLALVDVGTSAGLNLLLDRYSYEYAPGGGVGPPSTVHLSCGTRGAVPVPAALPRVAARVGVDAAPIDLRDDAAARWLEACVWPDQPDRFARLRAAVELARESPPLLIQGDAVDDLAAVINRVEADGHPVVMNSWVLNYLPEHRRMAYVAELDRLGADRDLSWVLAESPSQTSGLPIPTTPAPEHRTVLSMVTWRDGRRTVHRLASCHPHGFWLHWE